MPSYALPPGQKPRIRRRPRGWKRGGVVLAYFVLLGVTNAIVWVSNGIAGHLLPRAHGVGYDVMHIVVVGLLSGVSAAMLVTAAVSLRVVMRARRRLQP